MANFRSATTLASKTARSVWRQSLVGLPWALVGLTGACGRTITAPLGASGTSAAAGAGGSQSGGGFGAGTAFGAAAGEGPSGAAPGGAAPSAGSGQGGAGQSGSGQGGAVTGGATSQAGSNDAGAAGCVGDCAGPPMSCQGLPEDCGPTADESCCVSPLVTGGTFYRNYDGATFTDRTAPATVSDFRLDKYEVTVARFRRFVAAWVDGWRPAPGSGKHTHLNHGAGLNGGAPAPDHPGESGWDPAWQSWPTSSTKPLFPSTLPAWNDTLSCYLTTWTPTAGANENLPVTCTAFFEAYAFCIWDGAFLPTNAEWNYAASGGAEQRIYPWGSQAPVDDFALAVHSPCKTGGNCVNTVRPQKVGSVPAGNGKFGQADLAGNIMERVLDSSLGAGSCVDCAYVRYTANAAMPTRGGSYNFDASFLFSSVANANLWSDRDEYAGFRCARSP
ncbi:MAG: SUMF1/EgtB/PvdO family nonheme iron enzyme [Polyangiaceae bacterium]